MPAPVSAPGSVRSSRSFSTVALSAIARKAGVPRAENASPPRFDAGAAPPGNPGIQRPHRTFFAGHHLNNCEASKAFRIQRSSALR